MGAPDKDPKGLGVSWVIPSKPRLVSGDRKLHLLQAHLAGTVFTFRGLSISEQLKLFPEELFQKTQNPPASSETPGQRGHASGPAGFQDIERPAGCSSTVSFQCIPSAIVSFAVSRRNVSAVSPAFCLHSLRAAPEAPNGRACWGDGPRPPLGPCLLPAPVSADGPSSQAPLLMLSACPRDGWPVPRSEVERHTEVKESLPSCFPDPPLPDTVRVHVCRHHQLPDLVRL